MSEAIFKGASGKLHRFAVCRPDEDFLPAPAVYAFARAVGKQWAPVFLSRTGNMADRMDRHPQWREAQRLGATHILVHRRGERDAREAVEADLLAVLKPVMNGPFNGARAVAAPVARLAPADYARRARSA